MCDAMLFAERPLAEEVLRASADAEELRMADMFGSERRRREFLMWRHIVRRELGRDVRIAYDPSGAPVIENRNIYISVSHSKDLVAVVVSPRRCAVDAERTDRDFGRAAGRYLSEPERLLSDDERLAAAVWCAKETLYKYSGLRGLDLLRDIRITRADFAAGAIAGTVCGGAEVCMSMLERDGNMVVYIV